MAQPSPLTGSCSVTSVQLFATPWTVALEVPLSVGVLQARILEWVVMPSSRGSSQGSNPCLLPLLHCRQTAITAEPLEETLPTYRLCFFSSSGLYKHHRQTLLYSCHYRLGTFFPTGKIHKSQI